MKYWRGYLIAAIFGFFSWGLMKFAESHTVLIDMVYPYVTRTLQVYLSQWTGGVDFCVWQVVALLLLVGVLASAVLMILLKWNPIQWFGWVLTAAAALFFLNTCVYGLNEFAGSIAEDIRLEVSDYTLSELEQATTYFRDQANTLASQMDRDGDGNMRAGDFDTLAAQAADGFQTLVYEKSYSVYAGSMLPVKQLAWADNYTSKGITGVTMPLTGEAAVNPQVPAAAMPFAICREMAKRLCVAVDADVDLSAFLACQANSSETYQYSAYFMAYRHGLAALKRIGSAAALEAADRVADGVNDHLYYDLTAYDRFVGTGEILSEACNLMTSWYIREFILPTQVEQEQKFDPYDESQVDLSGIVNAPVTDETTATTGAQ